MAVLVVALGAVEGRALMDAPTVVLVAALELVREDVLIRARIVVQEVVVATKIFQNVY